jgi:hypothetical protein
MEIDIIKEIDNYINSFTLEDLLIKPYFLLDRNLLNYNTSNKLVVNLCNNTLIKNEKKEPIDIDLDLDYNKEKKNEIDLDYNKQKNDKMFDIFNQKKTFNDMMTSFITFDLLDSKKDLIFNFQYLVNSFFKKTISKYIKKNNKNEDDIIFMYKGGTIMKNLYDKYKVLFNSDELFNKLQSNFKRSDSDYSVLINNDLDELTYRDIYYDIYIINYNILHKIKFFLLNERYTDYLLPFQYINQSNSSNVLKEMNKKLQENRETFDYFKDVDEFIGISINNKLFLEEIPNNSFIYSLQNNKYKTDNKTPYFVNDASKKDFFLTWLNESDINSVSSQDIASINKYNLYHSINDNIFFNSKTPNKDVNFSLQRIKFNTVIFFKTKKINNQIFYGKMNCPSEIVDLSLTSYNDYKLKDLDFKKHIKTYYFNNNNNQVMFKSYSLVGFIHDIIGAVFGDNTYPWDAIKYEKKINRVAFLLCIYIYNVFKSENNINIIFIIDKIIKILKNTLKQNIIESIQNDINSINDEVIKEILMYIFEIKTNINTDKNKIKFNEMINLILNINALFLNNLKNNIKDNIITGFNASEEEMKYLKKYLKYKQKYLDLLKKN